MEWGPSEAGKETRKPDADIEYDYPYEKRWDVLRRDDLPDGDDIGLDYRLSPEKARDSRHYVVFLLVFGASATLGIIFIAHLFGKVFAHQITLVLVLLVGVFTALRKILARGKWPVILFYGFRWPVVWLVVTVSGLLSPKILLIIGVAACVWLADAIAAHHVLWLNADPNLSQETRTTIKTAWHQRWRSWGLRLAAVSLLVYSALLLMAGSQIISGVTSLLAVTTLFAVVSTVILLKQAGSFDPIRLFLDAMVNWLTYGRFGTDSPGVWQSPRGEWGARIGATLCAYILVASAILPFASYFPVVLVEGDKSPWVKVYAESRGHKFSASSLLGRWNEYRVPDFRDIVLHRLSHADNVYLRQLKNEDARTAYLHKQQLADYLSSSPGAWLSVMLDGVFMGEAQFYWAALLAFLGCLVFPLIVSMLMLFVVSGAILERFAREIESRMPVRRNNWEGYIKRLQTSPNALARQHLWLGNHATEDYPILIHQDVLREHAHILGDSGSGKSALAVAPIFTQLIRKNDATVVIIDLKGDMALFEGMRQEAGGRFKYFTNEIRKSTYIFNPFSQLQTDSISINQVCETFLSALGLEHGEGYGRSYFSRVARETLRQVVNAFPNIQSFHELKEKMENFAFDKRSEKSDAYELIAVIESLSTFEQINFYDESRPETNGNAIYWPEAFEQNQVIYFWLPAAIETASVREIAKLALHTLFSCAYAHQKNKGSNAKIWLCIDEFQHIASLNFKLILQQARSMGLGIVLSNQSSSDLNVPGADIRGTVRTNTRFKQYFALSDPHEMAKVIEASGETFYYGSGAGPRLTKNDLIKVSDAEDESVVIVGRGKGYSRFGGFAFMARSQYHIDEDEYQKRNSTLWPEGDEKTITPVRAHAEMPPDPTAATWREFNILVDAEVSLEPPAATSQWGDHLKYLYDQQQK